jgi:ABC-type Mn2+/Zn2+ transport system ATPase subunit
MDKDLYIHASSLNIGYKDEAIVPDINLELRKGQALALIGTNGSGKSTLLRTIVNLLKPLNGALTVFGQTPGASPGRVAYLGQFHHGGFILPLRAIEVVRMGRFPLHGLLGRMRKEDDDIIRSAMQMMGIEALADIPLRYLSGGQQQRTYLAQVLAHQADLLVLDEPTAGLDAGGRDLYLQAVRSELSRGAAVVSATHDIQEEATLCDQVMLLARRVVAYGPPQVTLTPKALLETFGIVITDDKRVRVIESVHGHDHDEGQHTDH